MAMRGVTLTTRCRPVLAACATLYVRCVRAACAIRPCSCQLPDLAAPLAARCAALRRRVRLCRHSHGGVSRTRARRVVWCIARTACLQTRGFIEQARSRTFVQRSGPKPTNAPTVYTRRVFCSTPGALCPRRSLRSCPASLADPASRTRSGIKTFHGSDLAPGVARGDTPC